MNDPNLLENILNGQTYHLGQAVHLGGLLFHKARDRHGQRRWVKQVPADDEAAIARLHYEAILLSKLDHAGVIRLVDRGRSRSCFFLVLEPAPGHSLLQVVKGGPLSIDWAFSIAAQLAELLVYLHGQGIICRTLPPGSLYVDRRLGRVTLVDLSAAWDEVSPPRSGEMVANAAYLSPEEAGGIPAERRSDIYVYGVLLFQLLAGQPPFQGSHRGDVALQHLLTSPPDLCALRPDLPQPFADLVAHCLAKTPARRFSDVLALCAALRALERSTAATESRIRPWHLSFL
jgi:serine/threonine protein kinase